MRKRLTIFSLILVLMMPLAVSAGSIGGGGSDGIPGTWYVGEAPTAVDPAKSPIVFVHGYNNSASVWWEGNDMYETALANGYQTAFIDLHPDRDMWENGLLLSQKLKAIYDYFGQKKLVVVGYSKGGVDTQTALVHYGAHAYVSNVITLSSPHRGTQLSDLAHSSSAGWLAALMGSQNDATRSLQTGYMAYFRSITDQHVNTAKNRYYSLGGTKWGTFGSSLYWGGVYLNSYGPNDGVVTVASSRVPGGTVIKEGAWNHTTIREGSYTFSVFKPYTLASQQAASFTAASVEPVEMNVIVKGSKEEKVVKDSFAIEKDAQGFNLTLLSDQPLDGLILTGPDGSEHTPGKVKQDQAGFFKGAWVHHFKVDAPRAGKWTISGPEAAYFYTVALDSPLGEKVKKGNVKASYKTKWIQFGIDSKKKLKEIRRGSKAGKVKDGDFSEPGVYNLTTEVTGVDNDSKPFERTVIESVYVDQAGKVHR